MTKESAHVQTEWSRGEDPGDMAYLGFYITLGNYFVSKKWHPEGL